MIFTDIENKEKFNLESISKINLRGLEICDISMSQAAAACLSLSREKGSVHPVFTLNAEIAQNCVKDPALLELVNSSDMTLADGAGVVLASKFLHRPVMNGKVAGVELAEELMRTGSKDGTRFYFLGSKPGVAEEAAEKMFRKYPGLIIAGVHDGYFKKSGDENAAVISQIVKSGANVVFVCLGAPAQEKWICENRHTLPGGLYIGLGGTLDVLSGRVSRAPKFFIKCRLEWFWRLLKEPRRIGRMMRIPAYLFGCIFSSDKG